MPSLIYEQPVHDDDWWLWSETDDGYRNWESYNCAVQLFTPSVSYNLSKVQLYLTKETNLGVGDVKVSIFNIDVNHYPTGTALGTVTLSSADIPEYPTGTWKEFAFPSVIPVLSGVTYALQIELLISASEDDYIAIHYTALNGTLYWRLKYEYDGSEQIDYYQIGSNNFLASKFYSDVIVEIPNIISNVGQIDWHYEAGKYRQVINLGGFYNNKKAYQITHDYEPEVENVEFPYWCTVSVPKTILKAGQYIILQTISIPKFRTLYVGAYGVWSNLEEGQLLILEGEDLTGSPFLSFPAVDANSYYDGTLIDVYDGLTEGGASIVILLYNDSEWDNNEMSGFVSFDIQYSGGLP